MDTEISKIAETFLVPKGWKEPKFPNNPCWVTS